MRLGWLRLRADWLHFRVYAFDVLVVLPLAGAVRFLERRKR